MTRRLLAAMASALLISCTPSEPTTVQTIYIGTYTGSGSTGIYRTTLSSDGSLSAPVLAAETPNPSFTVSTAGFVFAVDESDSGKVKSFRRNADGSLTQLSQQSSLGAYPCFVDISPSGNLLATANYMSGNVAVYGIDQNGNIRVNPTNYQQTGTGPRADRQEGPHAHASLFGPDSILYATDLGADKVYQYYPGSPEGSPIAVMDPGDGPRHLAFHPDLMRVYVINELSNSVTVFNRQQAAWEKIQKVSTLPDGFDGNSQCADIHLSPDAKFLYASNRGHNSIAIFKVDEEGMLHLLGHAPVRGDWPRNFALSPDGQFLIVANERSNNVVVFRRGANGLLTPAGHEITVQKPVHLSFAPVP